jgi:predicted DNA-binding protein
MKNTETQTALYMSKELKDWITEQAKKNDRSVNYQIRSYLEKIKSGKIKVEGIG